MSSLEIDLTVLEDMCSELEEEAVLFDKSSKAVWLNPKARKKLGLTNDKTDVSVISEKYDEDFSNDILYVFKNGKLLKKSSKIYKKIFMPIKYEMEVLYVLMIIEYNLEMRESNYAPEAHSNNVDDSVYKSLLEYFVNSIRKPAFIVDKDYNFVVENKDFKKTFKDMKILKELIMTHLSEKENFAKWLRKAVQLSYIPEAKALKDDMNRIIGYMFIFHSGKR